MFKAITNIWCIPKLDVFASRCNHVVELYCSWKPDTKALPVDAFSIPWRRKFYASLSFCMIGQALRRIKREQACGILIVPMWSTQHWFSKLSHMLTDFPIWLNSRTAIISEQTDQRTAENDTGGSACDRTGQRSQQFATETERILAASWRESSTRQYDVRTSESGSLFAMRCTQILMKQMNGPYLNS